MHITYPILFGAYLVLILFTVIRILLDTTSAAKALAYLLLVLVFPVIGILFYYGFGLNLRHLSTRNKAIKSQEDLDKVIRTKVFHDSDTVTDLTASGLAHFRSLPNLLKGLGDEPLCPSFFSLLINGEQKFPEVLRALEAATHFIHMEYYAWENDIRGNQIKEVLLRKVQQGVTVRVLYDDYASRKIKRNIVRELKAGGVAIFPRIKVKFVMLANRVNHRDHRKVIIIDGVTGFVGGINVSDRYDNSIDTGLYWRDTHVRIDGPLVHSLQRHFMVSWNVSQPDPLTFSEGLFPNKAGGPESGISAMGQVVAGGPVYPKSNIMLTYFKIFTLARQKLYITNPYFIPNESILNALKQSAISGVDVRLILPYNSDSQLVGAASRYYFPELVQAGVKIYLYKKGFVHAKTVVADSSLSVIGTANMDLRSFDLNFEIMSVIYGHEFGALVEKAFLEDLNECIEVTDQLVNTTSIVRLLGYAMARLVSSFL